MTQPPIAKRVDHRREHHGDVFIDPYEWLRVKDDPEVIAYLEAENTYAESETEVLAPLRQKIFDEIKARYKALAKLHHPDANGGDKAAEERLKSINQAYTLLKSQAFGARQAPSR